MIASLSVLLSFQLAGEIAARGLGLSVPGPVIGMTLLIGGFALLPRLVEVVAPTARVLLANLSLLFVPAGVGVVGHVDRLGDDGVAVLVAIVLSTVAAIVAGVGAFVGVSRLVGGTDD